MPRPSRAFQVFIKPIGAACNLACRYCYYLDKGRLHARRESMPDVMLETVIARHVEASTDEVVRFSWHGGEPTLLGLDTFRKIVRLQRRLLPPGRRLLNGMQTNGTLLDEDWCRFLAEQGFFVGVSLDGPAALHDGFRVDRRGNSTHAHALRGYECLRRYGVQCEILCVVHAGNVQHPMDVYGFIRSLDARAVTFLPLVLPGAGGQGGGGLNEMSVPPEAWGDFLCTVFDAWLEKDIGRIQVQIFEEAARIAFGQDHSLCIFRKTCGGVPVIERNGDFYACDHYVDEDHRRGNIRDESLAALLDHPAQRAFGRAKWDALPAYCLECDVLDSCHGGCPKNRFITTPGGEAGLNYLCAGYRRFFTHSRPWVDAVAGQWRREQAGLTRSGDASPRIGRNDSCPCGSGKKFKQCCLKSG